MESHMAREFVALTVSKISDLYNFNSTYGNRPVKNSQVRMPYTELG
jgi:hypothetical protein